MRTHLTAVGVLVLTKRHVGSGNEIAPRALVFRPLVKGNEALGTRLGRAIPKFVLSQISMHYIHLVCALGARLVCIQRKGAVFLYRESKLSTLENTASSFSDARLVSRDVRFP